MTFVSIKSYQFPSLKVRTFISNMMFKEPRQTKSKIVTEEGTYFESEEYQSTADRKALLELLSF